MLLGRPVFRYVQCSRRRRRRRCRPRGWRLLRFFPERQAPFGGMRFWSDEEVKPKLTLDTQVKEEYELEFKYKRRSSTRFSFTAAGMFRITKGKDDSHRRRPRGGLNPLDVNQGVMNEADCE
jgi:preprotein translocase subunit Sec61beta